MKYRQVGLIVLLLACLLDGANAQTGPATQPSVAKYVNARPPIIYWSENIFTMHVEPVPEGMMPMMNDGGGRFDRNLATPQYEEDTLWLGDYWGVGGTPNNPAADRMTNFDWPDVYKFTKVWPKHYVYNFDIEHWTLDRRALPAPSDKVIQDNLTKLNQLYDTLIQSRPDMVWGFYSFAPVGDFWVPQRYQMALNIYEKWKRGEALTSTGAGNDRWAISSAFTLKPSGYYQFNPNGPYVKDMKSWIDAATRLTYNTDGRGNRLSKEKGGPGFLDRLSMFSPALYKFYNDEVTPDGGDAAQIMWNVALARKLSDGKKPIVAYVWPHIHAYIDGVNYPYMTETQWRAYIRLCFKSGVDGLILWGMDAKMDVNYIQIVWEEREYAMRQPATYFMDWKKMPWPETMK